MRQGNKCNLSGRRGRSSKAGVPGKSSRQRPWEQSSHLDDWVALWRHVQGASAAQQPWWPSAHSGRLREPASSLMPAHPSVKSRASCPFLGHASLMPAQAAPPQSRPAALLARAQSPSPSAPAMQSGVERTGSVLSVLHQRRSPLVPPAWPPPGLLLLGCAVKYFPFWKVNRVCK